MNRSPSCVDIQDPMADSSIIKPMFQIGDSDTEHHEPAYDFVLKKSKIEKIQIKSFKQNQINISTPYASSKHKRNTKRDK